VDELVAKRVLADGDGANISFAHGSCDYLCGAAVEKKADCGFVFVVSGGGGVVGRWLECCGVG
jgi:hypothetical protein